MIYIKTTKEKQLTKIKKKKQQKCNFKGNAYRTQTKRVYTFKN